MIEKVSMIVLSVLLIGALLFSIGNCIYQAAYTKGLANGFFAIRVEEVQEDENGYTVLIGLEDDYHFHYCRK